MDNSILFKCYWKLFGLIFLTIYSSYFVSGFINSIVFILILISYYKSKNDIIFLALLLTIIGQPGFLYYNKTVELIGVSILKFSFIELFSIVSVLKFYKRFRVEHLMVFKREYLIYLIGFVFFVLYGIQFGMIVTGTNSTGLGLIRRLVKIFILIPLFLTIPYMINTKEKIIYFLSLIFALNIFNFITQLFVVGAGGVTLHALLSGTSVLSDAEGSRPVYGMYISFMALIFALNLIYYKSKKLKVNKFYLFINIAISFFSVILSATRGWLIAEILILLLFVIVKFRQSFIKILFGSVPFIIILYLVLQVSFIRNQVVYAINRFETLELLYNGDLTAGGTNSRLTDRSEPVLAEFEKRPLLGWGISAPNASHYDVHVGNQSMLMTSGLIGFIFLIIFLASVNIKILKLQRKLTKFSLLARNLEVFVFMFAGLFVIHSSSTDLFGFMVFTYGDHVTKIVFHAIIFSVITMMINLSIQEYNANIRISTINSN